MRIDIEHRQVLANASETSGEGPILKIDLEAMMQAAERLSLWEAGLLAFQLAKASTAKRKTRDQRVLLALFGARDVEADAS